MVDSGDRTRTAGGGKHNVNALRPGCRLRDTYVIERELGEGGFGITYLASHTLLQGKYVAIKEYMPRDTAYRDEHSSVRTISESVVETYEWGRRRFIEEANHLHRISPKDHPTPNVVCVQDVFEENNTAYMVMDFVEGRSLRSAIEANEEFDEARLRRLLYPLLDVLETIHEQGLIHRDITPSNIILQGEDESPVLIDFGSARHEVGQRRTQQRTDGIQPTMTQVVAPGYSPIEQYEGLLSQDGRTDIYSLAATLYYAAFKVKVVNSPVRQGTLRERKTDPLENARSKGHGRYSEQFLNALDRGLALYQKDRPANVEKWRELFGAPDIPATPPVQKAPSTPRWLVISVVLLVLAGGGYLAVQKFAGKRPPVVTDQLAKARDTLASNPIDIEVVAEAQSRYVDVRSTQPQNPIARAGDAACDALLQLLDALNAHDFQRAEVELNKATQLLQQAKFEAATISTVQKLFESMHTLNRVHERMKSVGLDKQDLNELSTLLSGSQQVQSVADAVKAGNNALDHLRAVALAAEAWDFQLALQRVTDAENAAAGMDFGPVEMTTVRGEVVSRRERVLARLASAALSALREEPLSEQSVADARERYAEIQNIDPDNVATKSGLEMATVLERFRVEAAEGRLPPREALLASVQPLATSLSLDQSWVDGLTAKLETSRREWLADAAISTLLRAPLSSQALEDARSALQQLVAEEGIGSPASETLRRARVRLTVVEVLSKVSALATSLQFTAATSEVEALDGLIDDAALDSTVVSVARAAVAAQRSGHVAMLIERANRLLAENDSTDALRQTADVYSSVLELDPQNTLAGNGLRLVESIPKVESLERAGELKSAWSQIRELDALVMELELGAQWVERLRQTLRVSSQQQVKLSLARALDGLRMKPLQSEAFDLAEYYLGEASAVADAAQDQQLRQVVASIAAALSHYRDAAKALKSNEFSVVDSKLSEASLALASLAPDDAAVTDAVGSFVAAKIREFCAASTAAIDNELDLVLSRLRNNPLESSVLTSGSEVVVRFQRDQDAASKAGCAREILIVAQVTLEQLQRAAQLRAQENYSGARLQLEPPTPHSGVGSHWYGLLQVAQTHIDEERRLGLDAAHERLSTELGASPLDRNSLRRASGTLEEAEKLAEGFDYKNSRLSTSVALVRDLIQVRDALDENDPSGRTRADRILASALASNAGVEWATNILLIARSQLMADVSKPIEDAIKVLSEEPATERTLSAAMEHFERTRKLADERNLPALKNTAERGMEGTDRLYRALQALSQRKLNSAGSHLNEATRIAELTDGDVDTSLNSSLRNVLLSNIAMLDAEAKRLKPPSAEYMPMLLDAIDVFSKSPKDLSTLAKAEEIVQVVLDTLQQDLPPAVKLKQALQFQRDAIRACDTGDRSKASQLADKCKSIIESFGLPVDSLQGPICD